MDAASSVWVKAAGLYMGVSLPFLGVGLVLGYLRGGGLVSGAHTPIIG